LSLNESYPQHVITAVVVAHDGAAWLPRVADALLDQTRPVQRIVAVDTGSRDRSGTVLASKFGQAAVFGMERSTGYGAAIRRALAHRSANVPVPASAGISPADRVEWLWLLHDDCEPAPDALEQLLRGVAETGSAAVLGPKLRDWSNREVVLEAGVTLDTAARRVTGIEPREVDQGQHDGDRDTLAVSSAGMLVRRDVWEQVGGFDPSMSLFMEDIDFCWRVHSAGYRVRVITDAICYHAQAATKRKRPVSVGRRARMLDRRNGLIALLGNLPMGQMLKSAAGNVVLSFLRISFFLVAKRMAAAFDEAAAVATVLGHPLRFAAIRRRRARGRRAAYSRVHADLPPGRSARRAAEFIASTMLKSAQVDTTGAHHASADPTDDDSLLVDNGLARRLLTSPALLLLVVLLTVALIAGRSLIGGGPLGGGSLVPLWGGASDLWHTYTQAFHPDGIGSTSAAPPYIAVLAGLATLLGGKSWLAVDVLLIGCVPLSGMTAMHAVGKVASSRLVRMWAAATYALLPVALGVVAAARFGTAVAFILLPLIVAQVGRVCTESGPRAGRAAWAAGLLVAIGAAFVPLLWLLVFVACCAGVVGLRPYRSVTLRNLAIVAFTAPVLLLPWTLTLISNPAQFMLEAGLPQPGSPAAGLPAKSLVLLSPSGPGLPPYWVTAGLLIAAIAGLFARQRRGLIIAGWSLALGGLLAAIAVGHLTVTLADAGPVIGWTGLPLAVAAIGFLLAAAAAADSLRRRRRGAAGLRALRGSSGPVASLIGLIACSAPLLSAASWVSTGVSGPVHQVASPLVPQVVAAASGQSYQVRTLVLRSAHGRVSYLLLRGPSPTLADTALTPPAVAKQALAKAVADLIAPDGGLAAAQSQILADFDIGYVLLQAPVDQHLASVLNNVNGLQPYSNTSASGVYLWQLARSPARVSVVEPNGTVVPIRSSPVGVSGAAVPAAGGTLMLAEPVGGWSASVNGQSLQQIPSPAGSWAQAFKLPPGGGQLDISHSGFGHDVLLVLQLLAFLALVGLALPGVHVAEQEGQQAAASTADTRRPAGGARPGQQRGRGASDDDDGADDELQADSGDRDRDNADDGASRRRTSPVGSRADHAGRSSHGSGGKRRVGRLAAMGRGRPGGTRADQEATGGTDRGETGSGRSGSDRAGAGRTGARQAGRTGVAAAAAAAAGLGASAQRTGPGGRSSSSLGGRDGDPADRRATRASAAWPDTDADDRDAEPTPGRSRGPQSRAWPYADDDSTGSKGGSSATQPPGWPYPTGGDERGAGRRAELPGRSPSGRSPSGSVPPSAWSEPLGRGDDQAAYDRPGRGPAGGSGPSRSGPSGSGPSGFGPSPGDRAAGDRAAGGAASPRASAAYSRGRGDRDSYDGYGDERGSRGDRAGARGRDDQDRDGGSGRGWSGLRGGPERRTPSPAPEQRRSAFERAGWRLGGRRGNRSSDRDTATSRGADESVRPRERLGLPRGGRADDYEPDERRSDRSDAARRRDARSGEYRSGEYPSARRQSAERSGEHRTGEFGAPRAGSDRRGGRDAGEPDWRESNAGRATTAYPDRAGAGDPGRDSLPPRPGTQASPGGRRRNVWRPDAGNAGARPDEPSRSDTRGYDQRPADDSAMDWERLRSGTADYDRDLGDRWLEPEPEYEGDSW
jgi:GT2 family glycosyltransferase